MKIFLMSLLLIAISGCCEVVLDLGGKNEPTIEVKYLDLKEADNSRLKLVILDKSSLNPPDTINLYLSFDSTFTIKRKILKVGGISDYNFIIMSASRVDSLYNIEKVYESVKRKCIFRSDKMVDVHVGFSYKLNKTKYNNPEILVIKSD